MKPWLYCGALSVCLTACNSTISSFPPASHVGAVASTGRALVVGTASGPVYNGLLGQYQTSTGSGSEDPRGYDLVVFDGNSTSPQAIAANPAAGNFIRAGKAVLLLNNTEAHRSVGFSGTLGGHVTGASPATIFFVQRGKNGVPAGQVDIEFPKHVVAGSLGKKSQIRAASSSEMPADIQRFFTVFKNRFTDGGTPATGPVPKFGPGTTTYSDDVIQPLTISDPSLYAFMSPPPNDEWCDDVPMSSFGVAQACTPNTNPTTIDNEISADLETTINVLLEQTSAVNYIHKVIARQYAYVSPSAYPDSSWETTVLFADAVNGQNNPNGALTTMLGFNAAVLLIAYPAWSGAGANPVMAVTESEPQAANNVQQLTTSQTQTEQVGVSVGGGYTGGGSGVFGVNWSDAWTWSSADTINVQDWNATSTSFAGIGSSLQYVFSANAGTSDTYANLQSAQFVGSANQYDNFPSVTLQQGPSNLNALQQANMISSDETVWQSAGGDLVTPSPEVFESDADFQIGEVAQEPCIGCSSSKFTSNYGNIAAAEITEPISIDFASPSLQPPAKAPWTLSFGPYSSPQNGYEQTTGTVTLTTPRLPTTPTTIYLSYVLQPQVTMLTLPVANACAVNSPAQFVPGNDVLNNGSPPLSVTIPAGQRSANFTLSFEVFNSDTYNAQIVAWLPRTALSGANLVNAQAAFCLTPLNASVSSASAKRRT